VHDEATWQLPFTKLKLIDTQKQKVLYALTWAYNRSSKRKSLL
jgi:hypothetical protein